MRFHVCHTIRLFAAVLVVTSTVAAQEDVRLASPGGFRVDTTGGATYSMPIEVPPGTNGMQPELQFAYNSRGPNGLLGVGWSLAGLSSITRTGANVAQDGYLDGVDLSYDDRFSLDGSRLVVTSGNYGDAGSTYSLERSNNEKIVAFGAAGEGPKSFQVWREDGVILTYGGKGNARLTAQGDPAVLVWAVSRIEDRHGNYITIKYGKDATIGSQRPTRIEYTGNDSANLTPYLSVEFEYETRPDVESRYVFGSVLQTPKRLSVVRTLDQATNGTIKEYRLSYEQGASTGRSRLTSITECDGQGNCLPATSFDWQDGPAQLEDGGIWTPHYGAWTGGWLGSKHPRMLGDVDGDGMADIVGFGGGGIRLSLSSGTSYDFADGMPNGSCLCYGQGWRVGRHNRMLADVDADGRMDIVAMSDFDVWVAPSQGDHFAPATKWLEGFFGYKNGWKNPGQPRMMADINADGRADIVGYKGDGIHVALSTGSGFLPHEHWTTSFSGWNGDDHLRWTADVDGDGRQDFIGTHSTGVYVALSTGTGAEPHSKWSNDFGKQSPNGFGDWLVHKDVRMTADVNGDGLPDMVGFGNEGVSVALNTGTSFGPRAIWVAAYQSLYTTPDYRLRTCADMNGDGRADAVCVDEDQQAVFVSLSTGSSFGAPQIWATGAVRGGNPQDRPRFFADTNGDGAADFVHFDFDGVKVHTASREAADLVHRATTGLGAITEIEYQPLTDDFIYAPNTDATYPELDVQPALQSVASYSVSDGLGGQKLFSYYYRGARVDLQGRGFLGLSSVCRFDVANETCHVKTYAQSFPFTGLELSEEHNIEGTRLYYKARTPGQIAHPEGPYYHVVDTDTIEDSHELDGSLIKSVATANNYDDYGKLIGQTTATSGGGETFTETRVNTYAHDPAQWSIGLLERVEVLFEAPNQTPVLRVSEFDYDAATRDLVEERVEPGSDMELVTTTAYDAFGNPTLVAIDGPDILPRSTAMVYDGQGRFPLQTTNAAGHTQSEQFDGRFGQRTTLVGPNGLVSSWTYDGFGRLLQEARPGGSTTTCSYGNLGSGGFATCQRSGEAPFTVFFDELGRKIRTETEGFDGTRVVKSVAYDTDGHVASVSNNYFEGTTPAFTQFAHDRLGRLTRQTLPDGSVIATAHAGLTTTVTNALGQVTTQKRDAKDRVVESTDALGFKVVHEYDAVSNLARIVDGLGNATAMEYDQRGRRTVLDDPDLGRWEFLYNALGELICQSDARGKKVGFNYDLLGRMVSRIEPEGTTTWHFDSAQKGKGRLARVNGPDGYKRVHEYDALARPAFTRTTIDGETFTVEQGYDAQGRIADVVYPGGLRVSNVFNARGFLERVTESTSGAVLWKAEAMNAEGDVTQESFGNGVETSNVYDGMGRLTGIQSGPSSNGQIQNLAFTYDALGNLTSRSDANLGVTEGFDYDALNRLISSTIPANGVTKSYQYDSIGNLTYKSDVGSLNYEKSNGAGPHAVTSINSPSGNRYFAYDPNGNLLVIGDGTGHGLGSGGQLGNKVRIVRPTSFNKPRIVAEGGSRWSYTYDPDRRPTSKTLESGSATEKTVYVGALYEKHTSGSQVEHRSFVYAGDKLVAVHRDDAQGGSLTRSIHRDHLGSISAITDEAGDVVELLSFDSWGKRRNPNWTDAPAPLPSEMLRGFTGHEHLEASALIHMNGRMYDADIGRFLSPDPFLQFPQNMQGLNRYSYVLNNPLSYTDPTGHFLQEIGKALNNWLKHVRNNIEVAMANPIASGAALLGAFLGVPHLGWTAGLALAGGAYGYITTGTWEGAVAGAMVGVAVAGYLELWAKKGFDEFAAKILDDHIKPWLRDWIGRIVGARKGDIEAINDVLVGLSIVSRLKPVQDFLQNNAADELQTFRGQTLWFFNGIDKILTYQGIPTGSAFQNVIEPIFDPKKATSGANAGLPSLGKLDPILDFVKEAGAFDHASNKYRAALNQLKLLSEYLSGQGLKALAG